MKVLVTGGAGYVGSVLSRHLLDAGHDVTVVDGLIYSNGDSILPCLSRDNFVFVKGDVRDRVVMEPLVKDNEAIVHLAAIVGFPACEKSPELATTTNLESTKMVSDMVSDGQLVLFASTGSNYGAVDGVCTEETPLNPLSLYGRTKTQAEKYLLDNGDPVVFRFATAFGLSPRMRLDLLINDFVYQAVNNKYLIMFEKHFKRTFVHVDDMARAFLHAIDNESEMRGKCYNVGDASNNFNKEDVALMIKSKVDYYLHFADIGQDMDKRDYEVSYDKLNSTGFKCSMSVEDGINQLIRAIPALEFSSKYRNV